MRTAWIIAALSGAMVSQAAAAADGGNSPLFDIPRLEGIRIDGSSVDWAVGGFRVDTLAGINGQVRSPADLDAAFRLGWNDRGLLVLLTVRDDKPVEHPDKDKLWRMDSVEFYLAPQRGAKDVIQPVVAPGVAPKQSAIRWFVHDHRKDRKLKETEPTLQAARTKTAGGYVMEVLIPWSNLGIEPALGREVAFQLHLNDADDPEARYRDVFHAVWYPRYGAFRDTKAMHRLRLAKAPGPRVAAAARVGAPGRKGIPIHVIAPKSFFGKEAVVLSGRKELARAAFELRDGRAAAVPMLPPPPAGKAPQDLKVAVDGRTVATIEQKILPAPAPAENEELFGARIQRTMTLLATSNPWRRFPVRILLYGQSIVAGGWSKTLEADLRERFPQADITFVNRAIGGFEAHVLVRTAVHDLYPFYPDLVIFHVYGGEKTGELERIVSNIRRYTTAEIMLFTHQAPLPNSHFDSSSDFMRRLAQKYNCELVEVREEWRRYLADNDLKPEVLLGGPRDVHPNADGQRLLAALVARHFRYNTIFPGGWTDTVRTYEAKRLVDEGADDEIVFTGEPWRRAAGGRNGQRASAAVVGESPDSALKLTFVGNRVDVIAGSCKGKIGTARVRIDGQPPSKDPRLYAITRPSTIQGTWWPGVRRISHEKPLLIEDWTLRITEINDACDEFTYEVSGSKTGPDGTGTSKEKFVSKSGRVVIEPRDFVFMHARRVLRARTKPGSEITWKVKPMFVDVFAPPAPPDPSGEEARNRASTGAVHRTTLAQGLTNGAHTLEIIPNGDGAVPIRSIEVHRPPLR